MSIAVPTTKEALADTYISLGADVSLHTGDPGTTGDNEATGGSPTYARQPTTWTADSVDDGVRVGTQVTIDVPPGTYTYAGLWDGSTFVDKVQIPPTALSEQGQIKVTPTYTQS